MVECVPEDVRRQGNWKYEFFNYTREINCSMFFVWAREKNKTKNHRVYIGPGADGSTEDKIAVDVKFEPKNTGISFRTSWREAGYVKSTWALYGDRWEMCEVNERLDLIIDFEGGLCPDKCLIFIHPSGDEDAIAPSFNHLQARLTIRDTEPET